MSSFPAFAQSSSITYTAAEGCPTEAAFATEVAAHLGTRAADVRASISVDVGHAKGGAFARVTYVDADQKTATRELTAATCAEVASAAALVTALAIEVLTQEGTRQPAPAAAPKPPAQNVPAPAPDDPVIDQPTSAPPRETQSSSSLGDSELGAGVFVEGAAAPEPLLGASAFVGFGRFAEWNVRAHVGASSSTVAERGDRSAEFQLITGRVDACSLPFVDTHRLALNPCLVVAVGSVRSEGVETDRHYSRSEHEVWGAAGPMLRGRARFLELLLDAQAGPWFPFLGSRSYVFERADGEVVFHEVAVVGWFFAAHVGLAL